MKASIDELMTLVTIVDSGAMQDAAKQLNQTSSNISRTLKRLEDKLGVTLLERSTRKLRLTEEGQTFLTRARKLLADLDAAQEEVLKFDHDTCGLIRVDSAAPLLLHVIVPLVQQFMQRYPCIRIELVSNEQNIDLIAEKTDVAIRFGQLNDSNLHAKWLCNSRFYLVASPAYLAQRGRPKTPVDLFSHDLIGFTEPRYLNVWPVAIDGQPLQIKSRLAASSGETIRELALLGNGIACLSYVHIVSDLKQGKLEAVLEPYNLLHEQSIHAVYYQQQHLPKRVRLFIDFLAEKLKLSY